jgi:hypothetical protein
MRAASFSRDRRYRYSLRRRWGAGPAVAWVMLNPSTADARQDDPTLRRCIAFSRAWGYGALEVVNLFALRSPRPADLCRGDDPVGPGTDRALRRALRAADAVVLAWGNPPASLPPGLRTRGDLVRGWAPADALCLGVTHAGEPRHPLYVAGTTLPLALRDALDGGGLEGGALTEVGGRPTMAA